MLIPTAIPVVFQATLSRTQFLLTGISAPFVVLVDVGGGDGGAYPEEDV